jgi:hypothetical protein
MGPLPNSTTKVIKIFIPRLIHIESAFFCTVVKYSYEVGDLRNYYPGMGVIFGIFFMSSNVNKKC